MFEKFAFKIFNFLQLPRVRRVLGFLFFAIFSILLYLQLKSGYSKISDNDLHTFSNIIFNYKNILFLILALMLMPLNWFLEVLKWENQMRSIEKISLSDAARSVLAGLSVSIFTPNRIGEFGGKLFFIKPENRAAAFSATIMGSLSQWIIIVGFGLAALLYLFVNNLGPLFFRQAVIPFSCLTGLLLCFAIVIYFKNKLLMNFLNRFKIFSKLLNKYSSSLAVHFSETDLILMLFYSTLRFLIYCFQFYLLLICFGIELNFLTGFSSISVMFLLQTAVPMPALLGLPARAGIAVFIFEHFVNTEQQLILPVQAAVLVTTFMVWIVNVLLPSILGMFFLSRKIASAKQITN